MRPAAIWLRPAFWTQTKSTSGCSFVIVPSACPSALPLPREAVGQHGNEVLDLARGKQIGRLRDVPLNGFARERPGELARETLGEAGDLMPRDGIERL